MGFLETDMKKVEDVFGPDNEVTGGTDKSAETMLDEVGQESILDRAAAQANDTFSDLDVATETMVPTERPRNRAHAGRA